MDKKLRNGIIIGGIIVAVLIIGYYLYMSGPQLISVGNSKISATPDLISVNINAEGRDLDMQTSQEKSLEIYNQFLLEVEKLNIPEGDIELLTYNTYPEYNWPSGNIKDYVASYQIIVRTTNLSQVLSIIQSATNSGALISGVNFELSSAKQNEYKANALKEASIDARVKADALAEGLGKKIARIVSVQSQDFYYSPYPYYSRTDTTVGNVEAEKAMVNVSPQDLEVTASVSVTYTMNLF